MPSVASLTAYDLEHGYGQGCSLEERMLYYTMARLLNAKDIIEIGVSMGHATCWLALAAKENGGHVTSVDWFKQTDGGHADSPEPARTRLRENGLEECVTLITADSRTYLPDLNEQPVDLILVDGDHSEEGAKRDIVQALRILRKPRGLCIVHDFGLIEGVRRACESFGGGVCFPRSETGSNRGLWLRNP